MKYHALSLICLAVPLTLPAYADDHAADKHTDEAALDTQTVTADFRKTDVQQIPEAVTVVGSEQIDARSAEHLEQVLSFAPNVNFASGASRGRYFQIRGIGERSQFTDPVNPSVGVLIDGIDMTGLGAAATLFDVQQVEVLRGPQGTRFGANALAGMINITSTEPTKDVSGYASAKAGTYSSYGIGGAVSGSLSDSVQARIAVHGFESDGYMENDFLNKDDTQNYDEKIARAKLNWQPSDSSELKLTLLYADIDNGYDAFTFDNSRHTLSDEPGNDSQDTSALSLAWNQDINSALRFESTFSASNSSAEYSYDEDWAYLGMHPDEYSSFDQYLRDYDRNSIDLRLLSGVDGRLFADTTDWVVGVYYMNRGEDMKRHYTYNTGPYRSELDITSASVYGEMKTWFSPALSLTYGLRAEQWQNDFNDNAGIDDDTDETLYGGKIILEGLLANDHLAYLSLARGYKSGGINTDPDISEDNRIFDTEFNNTAELGLKSSLLNDDLHTRIAAFYIQRKDQQVKSSYAIQNPDNSITFQDYLANAAEGKNYGLELESRWDRSECLNWMLSYGWLQTEFVDYHYDTADGEYNKDGRQQSHAPQYSLATAVNYDLTNALSFRIESEAKDSFYFSDSHDEQAKSYVLWHARVAYRISQLELAFSGRNLTDADVETRGFGGFGNDPRDGYAEHRYVQLGEPRTFMAEAKYTF